MKECRHIQNLKEKNIEGKFSVLRAFGEVVYDWHQLDTKRGLLMDWKQFELRPARNDSTPGISVFKSYWPHWHFG